MTAPIDERLINHDPAAQGDLQESTVGPEPGSPKWYLFSRTSAGGDIPVP